MTGFGRVKGEIMRHLASAAIIALLGADAMAGEVNITRSL